MCYAWLPCRSWPTQSIIGNPPDPGSGNSFPFGSAYNAEYQQVYSNSNFSGGPISITDIYFYNTQYNSGATSTPSGTYTVSLSSTTAGVGSLWFVLFE